MKDPVRILNSLDHIEIQFFNEDPDGEEDRAGDGYYFRIDGEDGWSGVWHSEDEATEEAIDAMCRAERLAIIKEAVDDGYLCVRDGDGVIDLVNKIDDRWFRILVDFEKDRVRAIETFPSGGVARVLDSEDESILPERPDGEVETGHFQTAVRMAIEAVEARLAPSMTV